MTMWRGLACGCLAAAVAAVASPAEKIEAPAGLRPYLVALSVGDIDAAAAWYVRVLGLRIADRKDFPAQGLKVAFLEADAFRLELVELKGSVSPGSCVNVTNPASLRGFGKYAFQVDDVESLVGRLRKAEVSILHDFRSAADPSERSIIVKDNEGNWLQFFERKH
jgi:catechol 2,3-dioxygenase-like lactoylglutathione lyase family enzyme